MAVVHPHLAVRTAISFLLVVLLQTSTANICFAPSPVDFAENNTVGDVVQTITVQPGVTLEFGPPPANPNNPFAFVGNQLVAAKVLDYEIETSHVADIICTETATGSKLGLIIVVLVTNKNDNPPVFERSTYQTSVNELSPVDTPVGRFPATDLDGQVIFYTLSESNSFKLRTPTIPELLVMKPLDYDKVKTVQLILSAQDTPLGVPTSGPSFTATTTIVVTILDVDNRPPWFQPCRKYEIGGTVICQSAGYTSNVTLNEQETGVLPLKPAPLYAIDGDSGINEEIMYSFLSGNDDGLFEINPSTGNVTMLKPADVLGQISLTVLAAQKTNFNQFATTTVTVSVQVKSLHRPQFQRPHYEGIITSVGVMAMDLKNKGEPLQILATDDDYPATGGINPYITYSVNGSSDFSVINGYLFMTKDLPEATLSLQVVAMDTTNEESATAELLVEVTSGLTTTSLPLSTTVNIVTTITGESTTNSKTTNDIVSTTDPNTSTKSSISSTIPGATSESITSTTNPSMTSESITSTTNPSMTSEIITSTTNPSMTSEIIISTTNPSMTSEGITSTTNPSMTSEIITFTTNPSVTSEGTISTTNPSVTSEGSISSTNPSMTSEIITFTTNPSMTSEIITSTTNPSMTSEIITSTTNPSVTSEGSISTTNPSVTSEGSISTASTAQPHTVIRPSGGYGPVDMAALGATLGVLLFISLVVIVVLALRIQKWKADWKKIYEGNMFRSSLQGGQKEGIQYTNEAFQNDEDGGSDGSNSPAMRSSVSAVAGHFPLNEAVTMSSLPLQALLWDDISQAGSDKTDSEKEVKPILTKERRMDEGYKSVWFKEDIVPDAKEEVVIIPDSREDDSEEEDEEQSSSGREDDEDEDLQIKTQGVAFNDTDMDSGLGVKIEDPAEDSEADEVLTVDL